MEFQNSYSRESFQSNYYQNTDLFEYSLVSSVSEVLLSIEAFAGALQQSNPGPNRLTGALKKTVFNPSPSTFFMNLPPQLKKPFTVSEILTYLNEELTSELKDFPVTVASVAISSVISGNSRSQDAFESKVSKKDSNFVLFELDWDVEMTMENVVRLMKVIPNNFHCSFNYQLQGLVTCSGGFFSSVLSAGENWKLNGEYLASGPYSWTKLVWFLIAFVKCPVVLVYARPESGKSSMNFLSSIECEKLSLFASRQDQGFKASKLSKGMGKDLGAGSSGLIMESDGRRGFGSKSRTLNYESHEVEDFGAGNRNSRIEVLEARLRSPQTGSIGYSSKNESLSSTNNGRHDDLRTSLATSTPVGLDRSAYRSDIGFRAQGREELASRVSEFKFSQREDSKPQPRADPGFRPQYKEESFKIPRDQEPDSRSFYREDLHSQVHAENFHHKADDFTLRPQIREEFDLRGSKEDSRPYLRDESKFKPELSQNLSYTPSRGLRDNFESKSNDLSSTQLKQRFSSVDRPAVRSSYFRSDMKDLKDTKDPDRSENLPERLEYRSKFQDQYKNFKEKYKFLDESSAKTDSMQNLNLFPRENERKFDRNLPEEKPAAGLSRGLYESSTTKSQNQFSQFRGFTRLEENDGKTAEMSSFQNEPSWKNYDKYLKYGKPEHRDLDVQHEPIEHKSRADKDQQDYLRSRSIDKNLRPQSFKDPEPRHLAYERPEKSTSSLSNYPKYQSYQDSANSSVQISSKGPSEPLRKKIIRNEFTPNYTLPNYELSSSSYKARLDEFSVKPEEVNSRLGENDREMFRELKEVKKSEQNLQGANWKCARCNKMLSSQAYECTECRLINWDQFYKVKSIQPPSDGGKAGVDVENRSVGKAGREMEEEADWVCSACQNFNKGLFFLCKSCRRPKSYVERQ